jgi:signal peptidase II
MKNKYYPVALLILIIDHATKWVANTYLHPRQAVEVVPGYLRFSRVYNSGVAFGLFDNSDYFWKPYALGALAVLALAVIFIYKTRIPTERKLLHLALAITMSGILGNFIDRVLHGYVIDFIEFHLREVFYWPTFNVADSAITIGIALLLIDAVRNPGTDNAAEQSASGGGP